MAEKDIDTSRLAEAMGIPSTGAFARAMGMLAFHMVFFRQDGHGKGQERAMDEWTRVLIDKVEAMRNAQRMYFRTRDRQWLADSKALEGEVDRLLVDARRRLASGGAEGEASGDGE